MISKNKIVNVKQKKERKSYQIKVIKTHTVKSPVISAISSPIKCLKIIKSQSNLKISNLQHTKPSKSGTPKDNYKITIKSIEKKKCFSLNEDEPSPITKNNQTGFSMTEEEFKEIRGILNGFNK